VKRNRKLKILNVRSEGGLKAKLLCDGKGYEKRRWGKKEGSIHIGPGCKKARVYELDEKDVERIEERAMGNVGG